MSFRPSDSWSEGRSCRSRHHVFLPIRSLNSLAQNTPKRYCSNCSNGRQSVHLVPNSPGAGTTKTAYLAPHRASAARRMALGFISVTHRSIIVFLCLLFMLFNILSDTIHSYSRPQCHSWSHSPVSDRQTPAPCGVCALLRLPILVWKSFQSHLH